MHIIKYLSILMVIFNFNAKCSQNTVKISGLLDEDTMKSLKTNKYLSFYALRHSKDQNPEYSQYFEGYGLKVSPKTINPNVVSLRLNLCGLRDDNIIHIEDFKKLKKLELPANNITDEGIKYITRLSMLEVLNLSNNRITDEGVKEIAKMPALKTLNLSSNKEVSNQGMDYLRVNTTLENLTIHLTGVSLEKYEEMKSWSKFKNLD